jgi:hypothetical protein
MRLIELAGDQLAAFASGMLDVIFTFAVVLERKGLLTRAEIAETLRAVQAQVAEQEPGGRGARAGVVDLMLNAFDLPVRASRCVTAGG